MLLFKYKMYPQGETLSCVVKQEVTGFVFLTEPPLSFVRKVNRWEDVPVLPKL